MAYGFQFYSPAGKLIFSNKTLKYQIVDSFSVLETAGNGSKTYAFPVRASVVVSVDGAKFCDVSVDPTSNKVSWSWGAIGWNATTTSSKVIIYVYKTI